MARSARGSVKSETLQYLQANADRPVPLDEICEHLNDMKRVSISGALADHAKVMPDRITKRGLGIYQYNSTPGDRQQAAIAPVVNAVSNDLMLVTVLMVQEGTRLVRNEDGQLYKMTPFDL